MTITVNGRQQVLKPGQSVQTIAPDHSGVAIAVNDEVVASSRWAETILTEGDRVEIVTAVQGG